MKHLLIFLLFFFLASYAHADQVVIDAGLGAFGTRGENVAQNKFAKIGIEEDLWYVIKQRFNGGLWLDSTGSGYKNSLFTGYQGGFEVTNDVLQASVWTGPSLITSPDEALGGILQFNETVFLGIVDKDKNSIGVAWNHFSSGSLETPNLGRDYLSLEIKFPF